mgnify:CR=1 FL=1
MAWQKQASWEPEAGEQRWRYYCIKMGMRLLCGQSTMRGRGIKKKKGNTRANCGGEDSRRFEDYKQYGRSRCREGFCCPCSTFTIYPKHSEKYEAVCG